MDVRSIAKKYAPDAFSNDNISHLKGLKMCSFMTLFGVFTSDYALNTPTLCKAANLSVAPELFKWLPKAPKNVGGIDGLSGGPESPWRKRGKKEADDNYKADGAEEEVSAVIPRLPLYIQCSRTPSPPPPPNPRTRRIEPA